MQVTACVVGLVINSAGEVLLVRHARRGTWELPGGKLEASETWQSGVRREVLEETGLAMQLNGPRPYRVLHGTDSPSVVIVGLGTAEGIPQHGDDAAEARWFPWSALPPDLTDCASREVLT